MRAAMQMINKMYNCSHGLQPRCLAGPRCLVPSSSSSTTGRRVVLRRLSTFAAAQVGMAATMLTYKHSLGGDSAVSPIIAHTSLLLAARGNRKSPCSNQQQQRQQHQKQIAKPPSRLLAAKWAPPLPVTAARASLTPTPREVGSSKQGSSPGAASDASIHPDSQTVDSRRHWHMHCRSLHSCQYRWMQSCSRDALGTARQTRT
jgi:hypothetical protein